MNQSSLHNYHFKTYQATKYFNTIFFFILCFRYHRSCYAIMTITASRLIDGGKVDSYALSDASSVNRHLMSTSLSMHK